MIRANKETIEKLVSEIDQLHAQVSSLQTLAQGYTQRERQLRQKEEVLHATLDAAADGILAVDDSGHVIFSNKQFAHMWHIPPDLIEAQDDNELLEFVQNQLKDPEAFLAKVRELYQSFHTSVDLLRFKDGRVFERHSHPLVIEDKLSGRVWTFRDITHKNHTTSADETKPE